MALKFSYKAKDSAGKDKIGVVEAPTREQAIKVIQENKLLLVSLNEKKELSVNSFLGGFQKVSEQNVAQFTRLLATMLSTGLPIGEALGNLSNQTENAYFKEIIQSILHDVQSGSTMSGALNRYPKVFNSLFTNLVKAGETSGKLDDALGKLADTLESQIEFKAKVKGALLYPAIIVVAMGGVGTIMITTVIPRIKSVYDEFGAQLPLPTRILVGFSEFLTNYTVIAVLILVGIVVFFKVLRQNQTSDFLLNNLFFRVPVFGPMNEEVELTVMTRTLGTLVGAGVGIVESLKVTAGTVGNNYFRAGLVRSMNNVEKGLPLGQSFRSVEEFPLIVSQLVAIGEQTGTVDDSLMRLSKFFQDSSERKVKALTTALEPIMILIMGIAVGGLAIAVLLPMFNLVNVIK